MTTERIMLKPGVWLQYVQTDRFKTGCFSFNLLRPLARADAAPNALLPTVMLRGCSGYPDMQAISRRLGLPPKNTAAYGHFGRAGFSWERTDRAKALRDALE